MQYLKITKGVKFKGEFSNVQNRKDDSKPLQLVQNKSYCNNSILHHSECSTPQTPTYLSCCFEHSFFPDHEEK